MQDRTYIDDCRPTESIAEPTDQSTAEPARDATPVESTTIAGHVHEVRDLGGIRFVLLRDRTGICQVVLTEDEQPTLFDRAAALGREDVLEVTGELVASEQAPGGVELVPHDLRVLDAAARDLPLEVAKDVGAERSTRLDHRAIDVRRPETRAIFSLRSKLVGALREWYHGADFEEVETPTLTAAGAEGGAELFPVVYYDREAVLSQSPQLYKQVLVAAGFDRLFEVGTAFRAEGFSTSRHVSEISMFDVELAYVEDHHDVIDVQEESLRYALESVRSQADRELDRLGVDLTVPEEPFPRITFDEAREILDVEHGHVPEDPTDLDTRGERLLGEYFAERGHPAVFVVGYPDEKFYYRQDVPGDEIASRKFDLLYRGLELSSGGQREHDIDRLETRMRDRGLTLADFEFYLEGLRYGTPPHGGFGLGIDRLVQQVADLDHVTEAILFPRDPDRLRP